VKRATRFDRCGRALAVASADLSLLGKWTVALAVSGGQGGVVDLGVCPCNFRTFLWVFVSGGWLHFGGLARWHWGLDGFRFDTSYSWVAELGIDTFLSWIDNSLDGLSLWNVKCRSFAFFVIFDIMTQ
jgi:hypothetical protein